MPRSPLDRLRQLCLALPAAHEVEAWGEPTFRVKNKLFAMHASAGTHHGGARSAVWCKAQPLAQDMLIRSFPGRYFKPPYVGPSGWVGVWIDGDDVDWESLAELLADGWRMTAPKRLAATLDAGEGATEKAPKQRASVKRASTKRVSTKRKPAAKRASTRRKPAAKKRPRKS